MKALKLYGPNDLRLEEVPKPSISDEEILVRVKACAICGSDVRNVAAGGSGHGFSLPRVIGHEISGVIEEVGSKVVDYAPGVKVILGVVISCGRCIYCMKGHPNICIHKEALSYQYDGGFAEFVVVPSALVKQGGVMLIPEGISFEEASITEPFSCALNGQELSDVSMGDVVVVIGAGPVGNMHVMLAKARGACSVILSEVNPERLKMSKDIGLADHYTEPSELKNLVMQVTGGIGADVVIVAAPSGEAQVQALDIVAPRGRVNFFGGLPRGKSQIQIDSNTIHYREIFVHGTSDSTFLQMKKILNLMATKRIDAKKLITDIVPLDKYEEGFAKARSGSALKVLLVP
ncbi:alcohol dehydrogenase catalytic domain-containing protein [Acetomicrobium sp.]|uniref:alcohol dehydrogenase catalytic domain-containing protein n=1 Tax=Acetomicrobium sp. TaxID=1872099 RepID=UPI0028723737|nr:alcohol dehydrogenase catalytic domain-containing protein [Acetomicrobium sp.]MDR9769330.1 alcohol dehydrogenase catalytic domain-containing protein [Acetomicrobium sp.]